MLESIRLKTFLSPIIEEKILEFGDNLSLFNKIKKYYDDDDVALLFIPKSIMAVLELDPRLKIECTKIKNNRNSKINFVNINLKEKCEELNNLEATNTEKLIVSEIQLNSIPFIVNDSNGNFFKKCEKKCEKTFCSSTEKIKYTNFENDNFTITSEFHLKDWLFVRDDITDENIKKFLIVVGKYFNVSSDDIKKLESVLFTENFIEDISREDSSEIREILIAVARSIFFKPRGNGGGEDSIDYHRNSDFPSHKGYQFYRLDCVPIDKSGLGRSSGKKRALFGEKDEIRYYIAYTENHDFSRNKIKTILESIKLN